jgi:hypothetical protein
MVEPSSILAIFDTTLKTLGLIREGKKHRNEKIDQALFALYTALNETRNYINKLKKSKKRNRKTEHDIALLWHKTSIPLRYIDKDLADRCFLKGSYWLEPDTWTQEDIMNKGIAIDTIYDRTREILSRQ